MDQRLLKDWQYEVQNGDTVLGFQDWIRHKLEADKAFSPEPVNVYSRREHRSA